MSIPKITAIIGSGTMGPGIAALLARYGSEVRVNDISEEALDRAQAACRGASAMLDQLDVPAQSGSVSFEINQASALDGADFVIEAVPEDLELKKAILAEIEGSVREQVILATNTSGIPISKIAASMTHPQRLVGMHWSNPPHLIPMIEVVKGEHTTDEVKARVCEVVESIGYEAVVEKEVPGFVENRILYAIMRECLSLLEQGVASQQDLDTCVKWGIGYKLSVIGPMRLLDMAGLDIYESVARYLNRDLSNETDVSPLVSELTAQKNLGMKSGKGLYSYGEGEVEAKRGEIVRGLVRVRKALSEIEAV